MTPRRATRGDRRDRDSGPVSGRRRGGAQRSQRRRGQAVVEFALILPVFLLITLGVVDLARIFSAYISLTNGVREAGIYASFTTTSTANSDNWCTGAALTPQDVRCPTKFYNGSTITGGTPAINKKDNPDNLAFRIALEAAGLDTANITFYAPSCDAVTNAYTCSTTSLNVSVRASYEMSLLTPVIGAIIGSPLTMSASETARILRP